MHENHIAADFRIATQIEFARTLKVDIPRHIAAGHVDIGSGNLQRTVFRIRSGNRSAVNVNLGVAAGAYASMAAAVQSSAVQLESFARTHVDCALSILGCILYLSGIAAITDREIRTGSGDI